MEKLKVKAELLPQRCEICHQADLFDATRNYCSRCANISEFQRINIISNISPKRFNLCLIDSSTFFEKVKDFEAKTKIISVATACAMVGSIIGTIVGIFYGISHWSRMGTIDVPIDIAIAFVFDYIMIATIIGAVIGASLRFTTIIIDCLTETGLNKNTEQ
jgi:LytS/YehU family sensor histidine kinase